MIKCQICKDEIAEWAWQPWGPAESPDSYTLLGSHYRGFPVIKVGSVCKSAFQSGDFEVRFEYKGIHFIGKDHRVKEVLSKVDLWDGGASSYEHAQGDAQMIMRTTVGTPELVAMVSDPEILKLFLAAPELLAACEEITKVGDKWVSLVEGYPEQKPILMALARVRLALKAARGEE